MPLHYSTLPGIIPCSGYPRRTLFVLDPASTVRGDRPFTPVPPCLYLPVGYPGDVGRGLLDSVPVPVLVTAPTSPVSSMCFGTFRPAGHSGDSSAEVQPDPTLLNSEQSSLHYGYVRGTPCPGRRGRPGLTCCSFPLRRPPLTSRTDLTKFLGLHRGLGSTLVLRELPHAQTHFG